MAASRFVTGDSSLQAPPTRSKAAAGTHCETPSSSPPTPSGGSLSKTPIGEQFWLHLLDSHLWLQLVPLSPCSTHPPHFCVQRFKQGCLLTPMNFNRDLCKGQKFSSFCSSQSRCIYPDGVIPTRGELGCAPCCFSLSTNHTFLGWERRKALKGMAEREQRKLRSLNGQEVIWF